MAKEVTEVPLLLSEGYVVPRLCLQNRFSVMECGDMNDDDDDNDNDDEGCEEGKAEEQWTQSEIEMIHSRVSSAQTVSSGVLLQPKSLGEDRTQQLYR